MFVYVGYILCLAAVHLHFEALELGTKHNVDFLLKLVITISSGSSLLSRLECSIMASSVAVWTCSKSYLVKC